MPAVSIMSTNDRSTTTYRETLLASASFVNIGPHYFKGVCNSSSIDCEL